MYTRNRVIQKLSNIKKFKIIFINLLLIYYSDNFSSLI